MKKTLLLILSMLLITADAESAPKKSLRKASSSTRNSGKKKQGKSRSLAKNSLATSSITDKNSETEDMETKTEMPKETWDNARCDSEYTRCMNKVCSSDNLGKCICYEDKFTNNMSTSFINIDGMKIKKGFETFEYAKKTCAEILDKCMENRRSIT